MTESFTEDTALPLAPHDPDQLLLQLDGFEGPIDMLLTLARDQKVDLTRISILALVEQYLAFINAARRLRLELAADWLVMAAWLAFLKSKLLLPKAPDADAAEEELTGEALAQALAFQLQRLEAMQKAARELFEQPLLGRERLPRGMAGHLFTSTVRFVWQADLYDVLDAYGDIKKRSEPPDYTPVPLTLMSADEARARLTNMLGEWATRGMNARDWGDLFENLSEYEGEGLAHRAALAATLSAGLEMAKQGQAEIYQDKPFAPVYIRPKRLDDEE